MGENHILNIISGDEKILNDSFNNFLQQNKDKLSFSELSFQTKKDLWNAVFKHLENEKHYVQCLSIIRILSRDKEYLDELVSDKWIDKLLNLSNLKTVEIDQNLGNNNVVIEALKCLCNLVYNSKVVQIICVEHNVAENVFKRLLSYKDIEILDEVKYFDVKLLFLITAFCTEVRMKLKENLNASVYLTEYLVYVLNEASDRRNDAKDKIVLTDEEVNLACEILKVLFNLTTYTEPSIDKEEDDAFMRLTAVLHDYLFVTTQTPAKQIELHTHIINLLTILPNYCLKKLVTIIPKGCKISDMLEYDGHNMEAVYILLNFLRKKFENDIAVRQQESLLPILTVLVNLSKSSRICRKYLRKHILPPLKDVHNRPEKGNTLRNNLCRLLTTPVTQIRDLAADLLFVLCKENVGRMIKYTGYGNAAGLFASRGLLGKTSGSADDSEKYSSDSEDSDTEEYKEFKHGINPIIGCYEPPHPDPTEGMTEEQKEYEAMKLVQLMDSLTKTGIVQPCRVGDDGKPEPITHVLQLQEELNKNKKES